MCNTMCNSLSHLEAEMRNTKMKMSSWPTNSFPSRSMSVAKSSIRSTYSRWKKWCMMKMKVERTKMLMTILTSILIIQNSDKCTMIIPKWIDSFKLSTTSRYTARKKKIKIKTKTRKKVNKLLSWLVLCSSFKTCLQWLKSSTVFNKISQHRLEYSHAFPLISSRRSGITMVAS